MHRLIRGMRHDLNKQLDRNLELETTVAKQKEMIGKLKQELKAVKGKKVMKSMKRK